MTSITLQEWEEATPASHGELRTARLATPRARTVAEQLQLRGILEITARADGLSVRAFAHVGRIEVDGLTITVRPKLAPEALLELLRYAYSLRDLTLFDEAAFAPGAEVLQDLLLSQLEAEARELYERGIARRYVRTMAQLASPKGRIEVGRLATTACTSATTLPCTYHPRSSDISLNRVVAGGLELGCRLAHAISLKRALAHAAALYAELAEPMRIDARSVEAALIRLDRLTTAYAPLLRLLALLVESTTLALEDGTPMGVRGFMFDMNRFFQALVGKFLRDSLHGVEIREEVALRHMMAYAPGSNPRQRQSPRPRPDFVVSGPRRERHLLDAKYRDLWRKDLPREMLYQLAIYALSQPVGATAAIIYPTEELGASEAIINIFEPTAASVRASVALRPIVIPQLLKLVKEPHTSRIERAALAQSLVGAYPSRTAAH